MTCPHCQSDEAKELKQQTKLGYKCFWCSACGRKFNERTNTPYNFLEFPTDIVLLVVLWRLRYRLSLRDLAEMFLARGFVFTHEAVREWEERFAPLLAEELRKRRKGKAGVSWRVDETYLKVAGKWCYLYRAIDKDGNLIDTRLSEKRDLDAARSFFQQALATTEVKPERVTTDGHDSYPGAIKEALGEDVMHRTNPYLNNGLEQDHRGIKGRYYPMRGFKCFVSASRFCGAFDELRNYFRPRQRRNEQVSLVRQRELFLERFESLMAMMMRV
jgi:transposase-like protein